MHAGDDFAGAVGWGVVVTVLGVTAPRCPVRLQTMEPWLASAVPDALRSCLIVVHAALVATRTASAFNLLGPATAPLCQTPALRRCRGLAPLIRADMSGQVFIGAIRLTISSISARPSRASSTSFCDIEPSGTPPSASSSFAPHSATRQHAASAARSSPSAAAAALGSTAHCASNSPHHGARL